MSREEREAPMTAGQRLLEQLEEIRGRFGAAHARQAEQLLEAAGRLRLREPGSLIQLHEALLFLRAFPPSKKVVRQTEELLTSFHERIEALRRRGIDLAPLDPMEVSGIAGTVIEDCLNYDVSRWLIGRFPGRVEVVWEGYEKPTRLAETLPRFLPLLDDDAYVEADVPYLAWLRSASRRPDRDLAWLLARFEALPLSERERAELFDSLELTIRWDMGSARASRTRNWRTPRRIFYHPGPFLRRSEVDLVREMTTPLRVERLSRRAGEAVLDLMREVMTVRRRELWGTTHGDAAHVLRADVGRGLELFLWGLPPERRLPLRAYVAGFSLKNGVPINYIEAIGLGEWLEVGFNTFYTFRDGESAWNYAQALRLLHQVLGVTCVAVYPYQIGQDNEEAIESGAFWFYRKLGFRPGRPDLLRIAGREEQKIAVTPGYRTPARTLRRLAEGHMFLELPGSDRCVWDRFRVRHIGFAVQRRMAARWGGDAERMRADSVAAVSRALGVRAESWTGRTRKAVEDLAPVLALIPDLGRWTVEEKEALAQVIRSKAAPTEFEYVRRMRKHRKLRDAIVRVGSKPPAFPISS
jgi:hypothetical protein